MENKRGRKRIGDVPMSSTERARRARRREAARVRALEVFAAVVRMEVKDARINGHDMTDRQAHAVAFRACANLKWLDDRLSDLDAAADFFGLDPFGRIPLDRGY